jgi:hypothetical protein
MYENLVNIRRIREQLEALHVQEQDALNLLTHGCNHKLHEQAVRLICRIRKDRHRLGVILSGALANGREYVRWSELQGINVINEETSPDETTRNVIPFRMRSLPPKSRH